MSDLTAMYAGLRGKLTAPPPRDLAVCPHPRREQRIERTEAPVPGSARYAGYLVSVTTEVHCDACDTVIGTETHTERRR